MLFTPNLKLLEGLRPDHLERLQDRGIALRLYFIALLHAQGLVEKLGLQAYGNELALGQPIRQAGANFALREEGAELIQDLRRNFEIGVDLVSSQILRGEVGE